MSIAAPLSTIAVPGWFTASHCPSVLFWILGIPETVSPENNSLVCSIGFGMTFVERGGLKIKGGEITTRSDDSLLNKF